MKCSKVLLPCLLALLSVLGFAQDKDKEEEEAPPPIVLDPQAVPLAKEAYRDGRYMAVVTYLENHVLEGVGEAMQLSGDAHFAMGAPKNLRAAKRLYERCLYEDNTIPFADHSYFQLGRIFMEEARVASEDGAFFEARQLEEEADFYLSQMLKKYPNSFYRDRGLNMRLDSAFKYRDYKKVVEFTDTIWNNSLDPRALDRVEAVAFIQQDPFDEDEAAIREVFSRHQAMIRTMPQLLLSYAEKFEGAGNLDAAARLFLLTYNLFPEWEDGAQSLLRLADLHRRQDHFEAAAFLYARIVEENPNNLYEAQAWLAVAQMMELGQVTEFEVNQLPLSYLDLVKRIRLSPLDAPVRARYSYLLALAETNFGNVEQALLILRNLRDDYQRGPFVGLYRSYYEKLLFSSIVRMYDQGEDWALDRLYQQHRQFLAFTTQTRYPDMVAKAYLRLDLPSSAMQVYENMWAYKESISGFNLAFEQPLTDYLVLLNQMRRDDRLRFRLRDYDALYGPRDRFRDRYLYVKTLYDSRTMEPDAFLEEAEKMDFNIKTPYDARRLRRIAVVAQEQEDYFFADDLYKQVKLWPQALNVMPDLWREAELYQTDRVFALGDYNDARIRYRAVYSDQSYDESDRDWAFLQIARLHELEGEIKPGLRIYGQIAYSNDDDSMPWAAYAKQRMISMAAEKELDRLEKEVFVGEF